MSIQSKINRDGVDVVIESLQQSTYPRLLGFWDGATTYTSYARVNKLYRGDNLLPEISLDKKDYKEVLNDDKVFVSSFFLTDDTRLYNDTTRQFKQTISIIFQADLVKLYGKTNRADEEFNMDVIRVLKKESIYIVGDITLTEGVDNVYSDLTLTGRFQDNIRLSDMSQFHVVKATFDVIYREDCAKTISPVCAGVSISLDGVFSEVVASGGVFNCITAGSPASVTLNGSALTNVAGGATKVETIQYANGNPIVVTTVTDTALVFLGNVPNPLSLVSTSPYATGQEQSYGSGDDGARFIAGDYASVVFADLTSAFLLLNNNEWSHKQRFTGDTGGYMDFATGLFYDSSNVLTTKALAFPNDILRDYAFRRRWYLKRSGARNWASSLSAIQGETKGGETGWLLPNNDEYQMLSNNNLTNNSSTNFIDSRLFNWPSFTMWSSTTAKSNTANAFRYNSGTDVSSVAGKTQSNGNAYIKLF